MVQRLDRLIEVLDNNGRNQSVQARRFPVYSYNTNFFEWASHFQRIARGQLRMSDQQMITEATKQLDGLVGTVAEFVAQQHPNDWRSFVAKVNQHLLRKAQDDSHLQPLALRQAEVPEADIDIYLFNRYKAITEMEPTYTHTQILAILLTGLTSEYHSIIAPKVRAGEITTFQQMVDEGNRIKRERPRYYRAAAAFSEPLNFQADDQAHRYLYNQNYYADVHPDLGTPSGPQQNRGNFNRNPRNGPYPNRNQQGNQRQFNNQRNQNSDNYPRNLQIQSQQPNNGTLKDHLEMEQAIRREQNAGVPMWQQTLDRYPKRVQENGQWSNRNPQAPDQQAPVNQQPQARPPPHNQQPNLVILPRGQPMKHEWERILEAQSEMHWKQAMAEVSLVTTIDWSEDEYKPPHKPAPKRVSFSTRAIAGSESTSTTDLDESDEEESTTDIDDEIDDFFFFTSSEPSDSSDGSDDEDSSSEESSLSEGETGSSDQSTTDVDTEKIILLAGRGEGSTSEFTESETASSAASSSEDGSESSDDSESESSEYEVHTRRTIRPLKRIHLYVNNHPTHAVIDSGSTSTFISDRMVEKLRLPIRRAIDAPRFTGLNSTGVGRPESEAKVRFTLLTTANQKVHINTWAFLLKDLCNGDRIEALIGRNVIEDANLNLCAKTGRPLPIKPQQQLTNYLTELHDFGEPPTELEMRNRKAYEELELPWGTIRIGNQLKPFERAQVVQFLTATSGAFATKAAELGNCNTVEHTIELIEGSKPCKSGPYPMKAHQRDEVQRQIQEMLDMNIIRPSKSPFASPIVMVKKKSGELRMCVDYRKLNAITKKDAYPAPNLERILADIKRARFISLMDLRSGYWQLSLAEKDKEKTAFCIPNGLFEFNVLSFGLCNAPATFQRCMNTILAPVLDQQTTVFLDDVCVYSPTFDEHMTTLAKVVTLLQENGLKLNMAKCMIAMRELTFLGYRIADNGMTPDPETSRAMLQLPRPVSAWCLFILPQICAKLRTNRQTNHRFILRQSGV